MPIVLSTSELPVETPTHFPWGERRDDRLTCATDPFDDFDEDDFDDDFDDDFEEEWDDDLPGDNDFQSEVTYEDGGDADFDD